MREIEFDEKAIVYLETLPKEIRKRIFEKICSTRPTPLHFFERLNKRKEFRLRVGEYRVIADIDEKIRVRVIGHRKNIYKRLKDGRS